VRESCASQLKIKCPAEAGLHLKLQLFAATYPRESKDTPRLKAFWRVAPSVLFNTRAILPAGVFERAKPFNSRTSDFVHSRRLDLLLAIFPFHKSKTDIQLHREIQAIEQKHWPVKKVESRINTIG
jgi:hypothetical protein